MVRSLIAGGLCALVLVPQPAPPTAPDPEAMPFAPRRYVAYRTPSPIVVDGRLDDPAWAAAPWTEPFVDIQGASRATPRFLTRAKMLWDDEYFHVAAEMEEPDVWGTLTARDSVIFHDNDFEVFIDPDGDSHAYYELEVNALGTLWDLLLIKPYRDGGPALNGWDIAGLRAGVQVRGTINRPGDRDAGWTVELALPWKILKEAAPGRRAPRPGEHWRINFSRVEWETDVRDGRYAKRLRPGTKDAMPEDNWVWSPQGAINMHMPERWGSVQFSGRNAGRGLDAFVEDPNDRVTWELRRLYYRQRRYREVHGRYAQTLDALAPPAGSGSDGAGPRANGLDIHPVMQATPEAYSIAARGVNGVVCHIDQDGRAWATR